jgi:error-prone DNA polymerase
MATYVELQVTSHFSFLRGASAPEELFSMAMAQGHTALGLADRSSVAGVVRGWAGQKDTGVRMIPGARVDLTDGRALLLYPMSREAWSRLTRLLSIGKARGGKGRCLLDWSDVAAHAAGMVAILVPDMSNEQTAADLKALNEVFGPRGYCALSFRRRPGDLARLHQIDALARKAGCAASRPAMSSTTRPVAPAAGCADRHPRAHHHRRAGLPA